MVADAGAVAPAPPILLRIRPLPAPATVAYGVLAAAALGGALAVGLGTGAMVLLAFGYVALAQLDLVLAVAMWVPMLFAEAHPLFNQGAKAAGLVLLVTWAMSSQARAQQPLRRHPALVALVLLLLAWWTLSVLWAVSDAAAASDLWHWYAVALVFVVMATVSATRRGVMLVIAAFVAGAVLSVGRGIGSTGRLAGTAGDPNYLGAWLLAGLILALGLFPSTRRASRRLVLVAAVVVLSTGLARTVSRGAFVAAVVTAVSALLLARGRRLRLLVPMTGFAVAAGVWLAHSPAAWQRITTSDRGDGRYDLWSVAWHVAGQHPLGGVGLDNFRVVEAQAVQDVSPVRFLTLIVTHPHVVHNLYLQLVAEVGIVGLVLFVAFACISLATALRAAHEFDRRRDPRMGAVAYSVFFAGLSMLVAGVFLSSAVDKRLWCVLALGPGLLALARDGEAV